jgi:2-C-methyl-D-erythritol 4-phosphate cytidylyltransferase
MMEEMTKKEKVIAIIFAGGVGKRFGSELPKQFHEVCGKDIILHTLEVFQKHPAVDEIYIGGRPEDLNYLAQMVYENGITKVPNGGIVAGGTTGQGTIYNILSAARLNNEEDAIVLINDGVRPIITDEEITENIWSVKERGSTVTVKKCVATPIYSKDGMLVSEVLDRSKMYEGVAPQSFRLGHILEAHEKVRAVDSTYSSLVNGVAIVDSASLVLAAFGEQCYMIEGNPYNMKVTSFLDKYIFRAIIEARDEINNQNKLENIGRTSNSISEEVKAKILFYESGGDISGNK